MRRLSSFIFLLVSCKGFVPTTNLKRPTIPIDPKTTLLSSEESAVTVNESSTRKSFWKPKKSWWKERVLIEDLEIGQELSGYVVQDYLEGKTGPKLYFECGVGRTDRNGEWSIVNAMLRLDRGKTSVVKKRAARLRKKDEVQLFVSRVQKDCGRLEVCTTIDDVEKYKREPKIPITSLKKNQEVVGKVVKLYPYGAIIDVGANRRGLLHITKVARLMNRYIDEEKGLKAAGLEKDAQVRLVVESVENKRLSLDFTDDVKEDARKEQAKEQAKEKESDKEQEPIDDGDSQNEELEAWAEYAEQMTQIEKRDDEDMYETSSDDEDDYDDDYDDYDDKYDEEMDIESSLGLDMY